MVHRALRRFSLATLFKLGVQRGFGLLNAASRSLPDFLIIGAQRCGTTSLFEYLTHHPDIRPSLPKETHFFTNHYQRGEMWYRSHFPVASQQGTRKTITGEATPYYLFHPKVPERVHALIPTVKLIVLLRNPIDRAYSHYHHEVEMGVENLTFEQAIEKEPERLNGERQKLIQKDDYRSFNYQHFSYLSRGIYIEQLENWSSYFPSAQVLILNSSLFTRQPQEIYSQVLRFLGLADWRLPSFPRYNASNYPEMNKDTRKRLADFFAAYNSRLYQQLGIDYGWEQ